jgi:2',3'-cyclic-nucleotide 2'-phosphodiesterase (5'-nucleotidase family)
MFAIVAFAEEEFNFSIVHTNDLHSHFEGLGPDFYFTEQIGDRDPIHGHYARLVHLIRDIQAKKKQLNEPTLTLDAGDWFSGTMFNILAPSPLVDSVPELEFFDYANYTAVTIGNHEFDVDEQGLAIMFDKAWKKGLRIPFVSSNIQFKNGSEGVAKFYSNDISNDSNISIRPMIIETLDNGKEKLKVGILGIMGPNACLVSGGTRKAFSFGAFDDETNSEQWSAWIEQSKKSVAELKEYHKVDVVIVLLHGGHPEDVYLQEKVQGIDVIVAGHTTELYKEKKGSTILSHTGCCGEYLGLMELSYKKGEGVQVRELHHLLIDDSIPADEGMMKRIKQYKEDLRKVFVSPYDYRTVVTEIDRDFLKVDEPNNPYGRWVVSGILSELNKLGTPVDLYASNLDLLRGSLFTVNGGATKVQFSDIFKIMSLGFDRNGHPGSPIVTYYFTKSDLWTMLEAYEMYTDILGMYFPCWSDSFQFEKWYWGIPYVNRFKNVTLHGKPYEEWPELVHIASPELLANFWTKARDLTSGLVDITLRDREGNPVEKPFYNASWPKEYVLFSQFLKTQFPAP